jgi:hypothetical protein
MMQPPSKTAVQQRLPQDGNAAIICVCHNASTCGYNPSEHQTAELQALIRSYHILLSILVSTI